MITRFRIEGTKPDKEELIEHLSDKAEKFIRLLDQPGEWECTEDVIYRANPGYQGRMVFKFHKGESDDGRT